MKTIKGDLLTVRSGVIVHQVNNCGLMNAGLAKAIRNAYPQHYEGYIKVYNSYLQKYGGNDYYYNHKAVKELLGAFISTQMKPNLWVVGIFAQHGLGRNGKFTDYKAFEDAVRALNKTFSTGQIYFPYGIGSGLAGGNIDTIHRIIETCVPNAILVRLEVQL